MVPQKLVNFVSFKPQRFLQLCLRRHSWKQNDLFPSGGCHQVFQKGGKQTPRWLDLLLPFNPLSPNSDQHEFSPNNIPMLLREMVIRVNKMITKEKMLWSFNKLSQLILQGNVWRSVWRIYMWILGLKGLKGKLIFNN